MSHRPSARRICLLGTLALFAQGFALGASTEPAGVGSPGAAPAAPAPSPAQAEGPTAPAAEGHVGPTHTTPSGGPKVDPKTTTLQVDGLLHLAEKLADRGDFTTAEVSYWQILNNPDLDLSDEKTTLLALAHMLRKEGSQSKDSTVETRGAAMETRAAAIYEKFVKEFPDDDRSPDALLELGRTLRDLGAYKLALARFYSVINSTLKFPSSGFERYQQLAKTAQFEIAQTHFDAGEYDDAGKYFTKVRLLDLAPADRARASFMAAVAQNLAGERDAAAVTLHNYLDQFPNDADAPEGRYLLATILRQLNRPQEAMTVTLDLLRDERAKDKSDPRRWSYWQRKTGNQIANEFFQSGDTFNALAIYKGLADLSQDPSWKMPLTYQIALCYERLRQTEAAQAAYQQIIAAAVPPPAGTPVPADIAELGQMSTWRLAQLKWRDQNDKQINMYLSTSTTSNPPPAAPPPAHPPAAASQDTPVPGTTGSPTPPS